MTSTATPALDALEREIADTALVSTVAKRDLEIVRAVKADFERLRKDALPVDLDATLEDIEKAHTLRVLRAFKRVEVAAGYLGIGQATLYRKLKAWGVELPKETE